MSFQRRAGVRGTWEGSDATPKNWKQLISQEDAIGLVRGWAADAPFDVVITEPFSGAGGRVLEALQVTTRSLLGAVAFHTGGILVDRGWLRLLGSGGPRLPRALDTWNGLGGQRRCLDGLLVADDVLGGFFAWFDESRTIHYLAPDTYEWEDLGAGYSDWLSWCFTEGLGKFYDSLRWPDWAGEVEALPGDRALSVYPPLVAEGPPIAERDRRPRPVEEWWDFALDVGKRMAELPEGATFRFVVGE